MWMRRLVRQRYASPLFELKLQGLNQPVGYIASPHVTLANKTSRGETLNAKQSETYR